MLKEHTNNMSLTYRANSFTIVSPRIGHQSRPREHKCVNLPYTGHQSRPREPKYIRIVSVLNQNEGGIGKCIPDAQGGGSPEFWWSRYGHSLHYQSFPVYREGLTVLNPILPCKC